MSFARPIDCSSSRFLPEIVPTSIPEVADYEQGANFVGVLVVMQKGHTMTDQTNEIWNAIPPRDDQVFRVLGVVAAVMFLLLFLSSTVSDNAPSLVAYTVTSFSGESVTLAPTSGRCHSLPLDAPAKSLKNDTGLHAAFFADSDCAEPVAVVAPGGEDAGFASVNNSQAAFNEPELSLLGANGALSYRTIVLKDQ